MSPCSQCAAPLPADAPFAGCPRCLLSLALRSRSGLIGGYRLIRMLGRGRMARVYEAEHVASRKRVALKVFAKDRTRRGYLESEDFYKELSAIAGLEHPNIVPLYPGEDRPEPLYYAMRLIRGGNLARRRRWYRKPAEAARLIIKVASAVDYGHRKGWIHRDLKPENILIDRRRKPYVADFGIACRIGDPAVHGQLAGTPGYMAPEQLACGTALASERSDVFSLGVILYELLARRRPFPGDTVEEYSHSLKAIRGPAPLWEIAHEVNHSLGDIVSRAIQRDPAARYASAAALAQALEGWLASLEPTERRPPDVRLPLLAAALLLFLLGGRSPLELIDSFAAAMAAPILAPICAAMGFAALTTATGCDRHLVQLLLAPLQRVRWLVLPGGILISYVINLAVPSQTSTAATIGPILAPLLVLSGYSPTTAGAAVLLGASFGGDLLNPGASDIQSVAGLVPGLSATALWHQIVPASIAGAVTAALTYALSARRRERSTRARPGASDVARFGVDTQPFERLSPLRALVPLVPVALLLAAHAGTDGPGWLLAAADGPLQNTLPVVRAMLIGATLAMVVGWRQLSSHGNTFFSGMGRAYADIISLTVVAQCFGAGLEAAGVASYLVDLARTSDSIHALSVLFPVALGALSGSGTGPTLVFAKVVIAKLPLSADTLRAAALCCLSGEFGRTLSPVAAVVIYTSLLVGVSPLTLIRTLALPLLAGAVVSVLVALR